MHGGAHALGLRSYMRDLGLEFQLELESDSTSAKAFASRKGLGKQRHVQTRFLWLQDKVAAGDLTVKKVDTGKNVSDILTKVTSGTVLAKHMEAMNYVTVLPSKMQKATVR